jgi:formyltetrahydrofolate synthetase
VAVNRFPTDTDRELGEVSRLALDSGATAVAVSDVFARGGEGASELARAVISACQQPASFQFLYPLETPLEEKIRVIAQHIYGADDVDFEPPARRRLARYRDLGFNDLPVCIAKTPYSLSHDPQLLGRPTGFRVPIQDVRLAAGAGFVYALAGPISTMPGMPSRPRALDIDVDGDGNITGLDHP